MLMRTSSSITNQLPCVGKTERQSILNAMQEITRKTCIAFQERRNKERDYVLIRQGGRNTGCWADLGRRGARQLVHLSNPGCMGHGTIVHELVHTLGFHHEQTRPDRDNYVTINEININPANLNNFKKYRTDEVTLFNLPYDFSSIMHYSAYAFAVDDKDKSIVPKNPEVRIGQRNGLSLGDVKKLQLMYGTTDCANGKRGKSLNGHWKVDMYEHKDHTGQRLTVSGGPGDCVNVFYEQKCWDDKRCAHFNDATSSVNTHNTCVRLYDDKDCRGRSELFKPGTRCHFNFQECDFNDKVSSVGSC